MDTLQISTGVKRIPIVRDGVPAGELVFNPADVVFAEKFYRLLGEFQRNFTQYRGRALELESDTTQDENGLPANAAAQLELTKEACQFAYDQIDMLFGAGTSAMVFGDALLPDVIKQFLDGIAPYIQRARTEKVARYAKRK